MVTSRKRLIPTLSKIENFKTIKIFEGLNALRFFAAFLVLMHHAETIKRKNELFNLEWLGLFRNGGNAVTFFFVLSGFLITYLLLKEDENSGTISIRKFYLKRVLRIWPLYYLLVLIGTIGLPIAFSILGVAYEMPYTLGETWYYFVFFLPGLVTFFHGHHFLEPLWSIGVEEVFYLFWAPLFKFLKKYLLLILFSIIIIKVALITIAVFHIKNELLIYLLGIFKFEAMAIGGLGAYFIFHHGKKIAESLLLRIEIQIPVIGFLLFFLTFHSNIENESWIFIFKTSVIGELFLEILFLYLILSVSIAPKKLFPLKTKFLNYLGEISYGIYMYHMLIIFTSILFLKNILVGLNDTLSMFAFYIIVTSLTIAVAAASKFFFEDFFLRLKEKI